MNPLLHFAACFTLIIPLGAADWSIPIGGNAFRTEPGPGGVPGRNGALQWSDAGESYSIYFHVDRPAAIDLALKAAVSEGESQIQATLPGKVFSTRLTGKSPRNHGIGSIDIKAAGYVRVELQGIKREGPEFAIIDALSVSSNTEGLTLRFVKSNEGRMFYWGRRGPSVHLSYPLPRGKTISHAYSEITVPEGQDPIGSYFMANGFGEGYFGMQVNSPSERRILFSVWSPFHTNNPREIPEEDRVVTLGRGKGVRAQDFGNEGSGGQSFMHYPWKSGSTYRFLTEVIPDGEGSTTYTAWFGDKAANEWRLVASFRRPKTSKHLTGFHSFLENFSPDYGHLERRSNHANQWVRDIDGIWHELTEARFTADPTGNGGHRLDFAGGAEGKGFFMRNGGFFDEGVTANQQFKREATPGLKPEIDFAQLPRP
jgi:hypothetical protein